MDQWWPLIANSVATQLVPKGGCANHRDRPFADNSKGKFCLINWLLFGDVAIRRIIKGQCTAMKEGTPHRLPLRLARIRY